MITIEQLLESVDLDFEPRWVTKDFDGTVFVWEGKPIKSATMWADSGKHYSWGRLKLAEFENKPWTECIYEEPRKTTGKIERLKTITDPADIDLSVGAVNRIWDDTPLVHKINELVDAVNELKENKGTQNG
jgi:hypothetical protein